jgi:hypothetical protein
MARGMAQVAEYLPSMHEAPVQTSVTHTHARTIQNQTNDLSLPLTFSFDVLSIFEIGMDFSFQV